jgi:cell division protein FtsI (penicillin-binding protein 3)
MRKAAAIKVRPTRKPADLKRMLFTRFMLIVAVFILWIGGISVRLVHLQVNQHEYLLAKAQGQRLNIKKTKMMRGTIYDRNGAVLAMSVPVRTLFANATEIEDVPRAAREIAKAAGLDSKQLLSRLTEAKSLEKSYVPIAKKIDEDTVKRINKALFDPDLKKADEPKYAGLHWDEGQKRSYPYRTLAAPTVGVSNDDDDGVAGIEQSQNSILEGEIIKKYQERDRLGRVYDERILEREPPKDIVLTIDKAIQIVTEEALAQGVANANARAGMALVIDPTNGEILSLANSPTFDPENLRGPNIDTANHLVQSVYSPGSIFKLVTYSSALEKKLFKPTDMIDAGNGTIEIAGHKFTDSHHIGRVTYADALAHSSNVCAIKTGMRVGKADFYSMIQKMGFGKRTGVELPAETAGIVRNPDKWNGDSLASMSIGYEIGVTPLQIAAAFATIANDGIRNKPHIIKEIRDSEGNTISATEPEQTQVVSADTAADLRLMLRQVVLSGTGKRAQLDGYSSAGKTGTAWKFDPKTKRVERSKYMSSFVGYAPANDPKYVIAVVMDEPKSGARDGGSVAAPVFKEIAQQLLENLKLPRDLSGESQTAVSQSEDVPEVSADAESTVSGPPSEKDSDTIKSSEPKVNKILNSPTKQNNKEKPKRDDRVATTRSPTSEKTGPAIWKTKPKT